MLAFQRNPDKLEAKALTYEQRGKTAKALKYRQKAMRLRQNTTGGALATPLPMTTTRTPAMYEQNALKWEQRNNWTKAQKNREKAWRLNNPQYMNTAAPAFYQNNKFLGYNVPVTGTTLSGLPLSGARSTGTPLSGLSRNPQSLEQKALAYEQRGKPMKAQKYREKAMRLRQHQATGATSMPWNPRTSARYEQNALKWEQRNNWTKAQKNREKVWRLNNPQQSTFAAPMFYQNNKFVGYNQPFTNLPLTSMTNAPLSGNAASTGLPLVGGLSRNPDTLEQRALAYQQKGKPLKAQKYREKAMRLRQHQTTGATGMPWTARSPARYEQNALKWEQRNNWTKAQKNREKVWRLNNPQQSTFAAPMFYQSNRFVGYNQPFTNQPRLGLGLNQPGLSLNKPGMGQMGTHTIFNAPIVEQIVRPTIVDQTMRPERITEIQPIVHREIEAPQVRIVEKHLYETVPSAGPSTITNAPIIQETVMPRIIQEVQPVVHREVPAPFIEKVEQHVTEHIVKPTITTKEIQGANAGIAPVAAGGPRPILNNNLNNRPL